MNVHLPKKHQVKGYDLYGQPGGKPSLTPEQMQDLKAKYGPDAMPVDLSRRTKKRREAT